MNLRTRATYALVVLFAINTLNFFDRQVLGAVAEPIRREWGLGDTQMGMLGTVFTLLYAVIGLPLGRLTDRARRTRLIAGGVFLWSLMTALSGVARGYWELFVMRLGVGVGEAVCAPAGSSLIGDLYPAEKRSRALSIFMLGLPVGIALSYALSGTIAKSYGWRAAFFVAGVPGLLCALAALSMREPPRGTTEAHGVGARRREGSPYWLVLATPTMLWIIVSGALQNFNMYAIGQFLTPFVMRWHGADIQQAGFVTMVVFGLSGIPGLLLGGVIGDAIRKRRDNGRMLVGAIALLLSVPLIFFALGRPGGSLAQFIVLMGAGCALMNVYYSTVYSAIQDVIEPSLRGTAMALYFCAMYLLGASLGPVGTGFLSDYFTAQAAGAAGVTELTREALEPFRASGLRSAMYVIPALGAALTLVLLAGSRTVTNDMRKLQSWMRDASLPSNSAGGIAAEAGD